MRTANGQSRLPVESLQRQVDAHCRRSHVVARKVIHDPEQSLAEMSRWLLTFSQRTPVCPMSPSYPSRPFAKFGADGLFQVISQRYERGSTVITTNRSFKQWPEIFNNDSTLTSALLDRLLHHAESVVIEGRSYRMRDQTDA